MLRSAIRNLGLVTAKRSLFVVSLVARMSALVSRGLPHRVRLFPSRYLGNYRYTPSCPRAVVTFGAKENDRERTLSMIPLGCDIGLELRKGVAFICRENSSLPFS